MEALSDFFAMGGYARYVWPAYGIAIATLGGVAIAAVVRLRRAEQTIAALEATGAVRRRGASAEPPAEAQP